MQKYVESYFRQKAQTGAGGHTHALYGVRHVNVIFALLRCTIPAASPMLQE